MNVKIVWPNKTQVTTIYKATEQVIVVYYNLYGFMQTKEYISHNYTINIIQRSVSVLYNYIF